MSQPLNTGQMPSPQHSAYHPTLSQEQKMKSLQERVDELQRQVVILTNTCVWLFRNDAKILGAANANKVMIVSLYNSLEKLPLCPTDRCQTYDYL